MLSEHLLLGRSAGNDDDDGGGGGGKYRNNDDHDGYINGCQSINYPHYKQTLTNWFIKYFEISSHFTDSLKLSFD